MSTVALDIGSTSLAAVQLDVRGERIRLERALVRPLPEGLVHAGEIADREAVAEHIKALWKSGRFSGRRVRLGVANRRVLVRMMDLPTLDDEASMRAAVEEAVTEHLPISAPEAVVDSRPVARYWTGTESRERRMVVAAQRGMIDGLVATVRSAGLQPVGIDLEAFALLRAVLPQPMLIDEGSADTPARVVCHVGGEVVQVVVAVDRRCHFTRQIDGGGVALTRAVAERAGLDPEEAEAAKRVCGFLGDTPEGWEPDAAARVRHALALAARPLVREIGRSLDYYRAQPDARPIGGVVLTGGGALCAGLDRYLWQALGIPVEVGDARLQIDEGDALDPDTAARVSVAVGLALDGSDDL
ncbi:MAG: type IV pilus assembly protein PilM [Miltoncostaeaceae bacterium]